MYFMSLKNNLTQLSTKSLFRNHEFEELLLEPLSNILLKNCLSQFYTSTIAIKMGLPQVSVQPVLIIIYIK